MPTRLAACNPCRSAKVSCDHKTPCGRCSESGNDCTYRERPFKKRRVGHDNTPNHLTSPARLPQTSYTTGTPSAGPPSASNVYPNPGYQGLSSHTSIFNQVNASSGATDGFLQVKNPLPNETINNLEDHEASRHAALLADIQKLNIKASTELIIHWISRGINLALAGPLVMSCVDSVGTLFNTTSGAGLVTTLFRSSRERISADGSMAVSTFCERFCRSETGWATLGMFLIALSRAIEDTDSYPLLYDARNGQQRLQKLALQYADQCLEICLSLDCLNDLQLILQYESFIAHSMIDGDQSYHSWRRLGDVISSLYALGYHDHINLKALAPVTLSNLRSAAFCRTYSADKNVSIFLGRPPRMHRKHSALHLSSEDIAHLFDGVLSSDTFDYSIETCWTTACGILKERVLDLAQVQDESVRAQILCTILQDCAALEASLPIRYQLPGHLKTFQGSAVERDFTASAALNDLHVRFLAHSSSMSRSSEPGEELIRVSAATLKLAAEVAVLKPSLANSGTGFIWKIVFYGLPAAGVVCLALINRQLQNSTALPVAQAVQDLSVIVAHVEAGVLISPDQPNYALLQAAVVTIKSVLQKLMASPLQNDQNHQASDMWLPWAGDNDPLDFELDFWTNLAEHPALYQVSA